VVEVKFLFEEAGANNLQMSVEVTCSFLVQWNHLKSESSNSRGFPTCETLLASLTPIHK
jgi:hypothetical protein